MPPGSLRSASRRLQMTTELPKKSSKRPPNKAQRLPRKPQEGPQSVNIVVVVAAAAAAVDVPLQGRAALA
eukprot:4066480-Pyramimonas_sp.AAC.1